MNTFWMGKICWAGGYFHLTESESLFRTLRRHVYQPGTTKPLAPTAEKTPRGNNEG